MPAETQSLFEGLPPDECSRLTATLTRRRFPEGATVIALGDGLAEIYVIESGQAEVLLPDRHGAPQHIAVVGPGDTLGEMAFFTGLPATATVRAVTDLDVRVLGEADLLRIAESFPRVYRNLGAILSHRLARTTRQSLRPTPGRLALLSGDGAPPLLGHALAASVAWHTRRPTLLLLVTDRPTPEQSALAARRPPAPETNGTGADVLLAAPTGPYSPEDLPRTVASLCDRYSHVLLQLTGTMPGLAGTHLRLSGAHERSGMGNGAGGRPDLVLRAWAPGSRPYPDAAGVLSVPALEAADEKALTSGLLPSTTPAGRALGWAARHLSGLKTGLALGGGTEKGYAHIGVWRVLRRLGFTADYLAGTSIGSIVAGLYALGYDSEQALQIMDQVAGSVYRLTLPTASFLSNSGLKAGLRRICGSTRIEDLQLPLGVVAVDLLSGREVLFRRGLLWPAVLASASLPGVFPPQRVGPHLLVDGGVLNPVPSNIAADMGADRVLAVKLGTEPLLPPIDVEGGEVTGRPPWVLQTIIRATDVMYTRIEAFAAKAATILIEPVFKDGANLGVRNFTQGRRYLEAGEAAAEAALPRIRAACPWLSA
jgi:NTE family protein